MDQSFNPQEPRHVVARQHPARHPRRVRLWVEAIHERDGDRFAGAAVTYFGVRFSSIVMSRLLDCFHYFIAQTLAHGMQRFRVDLIALVLLCHLLLQ